MSVNYNPSVVTSGLVLNLDAANIKSYPASGTSWFDLSGNGNTGTLTNGPTFNSANGGSIVFNGVNNYISGLGSLSINSGLPFTIESWCNLSAYSDSYPTIIQISTNTTYSANLSLSTITNYVGIVFGSNTSWATIRTNNSPTTGIWHHIILTYNGSGSTNISNFNIYLDTIQQTLAAANAFNALSQANYIGTTNAASRGIDDFIGNISNVKVYNRALSSQEILQNFNAMRGRYGL